MEKGEAMALALRSEFPLLGEVTSALAPELLITPHLKERCGVEVLLLCRADP